ncbi:MAG: succinate dehydrogenase assembly factor 2 [Acetobacteraceae bacterium]
MTESVLAPDPRRRRLLYRATHRGTRENDLLVGGYVAARIGGMNEATLAALERLLEAPEPDLAGWLAGTIQAPPEYDGPLLRAMREAAQQ